MKIFIRIIRVILGLALLAAFAFGLYTFAQAAPKSGDYISASYRPNSGDFSRVRIPCCK